MYRFRECGSEPRGHTDRRTSYTGAKIKLPSSKNDFGGRARANLQDARGWGYSGHGFLGRGQDRPCSRMTRNRPGR